MLTLLLALVTQDPITTNPPAPPIAQTGEGIVQVVVKRSDTAEPTGKHGAKYRRVVATSGNHGHWWKGYLRQDSREYTFFAWENLPTGAEANAEYGARYEGRGRSITVKAGSTLSNIMLPLIED